MSVLDNLLRQHRWELDERRRFVAELEALAERLRRDTQRLRQQIAEETSAGRLVQGAAASYPIFVHPLIERRDKLERSIAEIEASILKAREAAAAAEQQIRLHEAALAQRTATDRRGRQIRRHRRGDDALTHTP